MKTTGILQDANGSRIPGILCGAMITSGVTQSFLFSVFPALGRDIGMSDLEIATVSSLPAVSYVLAAPILGGLVDKIGALFLIRIGLLVGVLSNLAFAVTILLAQDGQLGPKTALGLLLSSRIALNVAWGGMFPAAQAFMALSTSASKRVGGIALLAGASGIGTVLGPIIPSLVAPFGPITSFYVVAALGAVSLFSTILVSNAATNNAVLASVSIRAFWDQSTRQFFITAFVLLTTLTTVHQITAFQIQDAFGLGLIESTSESGHLLTTVAFSMLAAQWLIASGALTTSSISLMTIGAALGSASMLAFVSGVSCAAFPLFYLASALFGAALGLLLPTNAAGLSLALPKGAQGKAAGLLGSAQGTGRIVGPLLGTFLYGWSASAPYWFGLAGFAVIAYFGVIRGLTGRRG